MTPEEIAKLKAEIESSLTERFVLIPKNRIYHVLGGAGAFIIAAFGFSFAGYFAGLHTDESKKAAKRIQAIRSDVEKHFVDLHIGSYLQSGDAISLTSGSGKLVTIYPTGLKQDGTQLVQWTPDPFPGEHQLFTLKKK